MGEELLLTIQWQILSSKCGIDTWKVILQPCSKVLLSRESIVDDKLWGEISTNTDSFHTLK